MNVLILGANGMLGPWVIKALEGQYNLRLTDINELETRHEYFQVDVSNIDEVVAAADGMDAIINLSVLRMDRKLSFDVSARGCYNMMTAAVEHGINRVINTGPFYAVAGPTYERFDHLIGPDNPPQPGTFPYAHTKALGQEICRVFTEEHDIHVMCLLFYMFLDPENHKYDDPNAPDSPIANVGRDIVPFSVSWKDAADSFKCALDIDLSTLPSKSETFFMFPDLPHKKFLNEKSKRLLGWEPQDQLEQFWKKAKS